MAKLYRYEIRGRNDLRITGNPAESLQGIITECLSSRNLTSHGPKSAGTYHPCTHLSIDVLEGINLVIEGATLTLNKGEDVRVHKFGGFGKTYEAQLGEGSVRGQLGKKNIFIDGLEVLDPSGETKSRYAQYADYVFRDD